MQADTKVLIEKAEQIRSIFYRLEEKSSSVEGILRFFFLDYLHWEELKKEDKEDDISISLKNERSIKLHPLAQAAEVSVYWTSWPEKALPSLAKRREISEKLASRVAEHLLCFVSEEREVAFVWRVPKKGEKKSTRELRSLSWLPDQPARTTLERLTYFPDSQTPNPILALDQAFSVEAVTEQFFQDYREILELIKKDLLRKHSQSKDPAQAEQAHAFAHQLLNRLIFIYFIQRKRYTEGDYWLHNDPNFLLHFWKEYKQNPQKGQTFYKDWLSVLFFEVFNKRFAPRSYFPAAYNSALRLFPYLNGGLFTRNEFDQAFPKGVSDEIFEVLFDELRGTAPGFLERYNFTIAESTPLDIEVAVDPEMLGRVYEGLVHLEEAEAGEEARKEAGIFYTPREEIDLMCRLALIQRLSHRFPKHTKVFYRWILDKDAQGLTHHSLWRKVYEELRSYTICDPVSPRATASVPIHGCAAIPFVIQPVGAALSSWGCFRCWMN